MDSPGLPEAVLAFVFVIAILGTGFWIWMLVECATKESDTGNTKVVWALIIVFTNMIGANLLFRETAATVEGTREVGTMHGVLGTTFGFLRVTFWN